MEKIRSTNLAWWVLYVRAGFLLLLGLALFIWGGRPAPWLLITLSILLVGAGIAGRQFWKSSSIAHNPDYWFLISGLVDLGAAIGLLFFLGSTNPAKGIATIMGALGVLIGITQAVAAMFAFLGVKANSQSASDMQIIALHFVGALLGGGMAFMLVQQPYAEESVRLAGLFPAAMALVLVLMTRRLQTDAQLDADQEAGD